MATARRTLLRTPADVLPEIVFTPANDNAASQRISRMRQQGLLRQLYRGVYSSNLNDCVFRPIVTADFGIVTAHFGR
jgi:hypothetical protein